MSESKRRFIVREDTVRAWTWELIERIPQPLAGYTAEVLWARFDNRRKARQAAEALNTMFGFREDNNQ